MKRRKVLQLLSLVPSALLANSCGDNLPSTPTVVTGKIIDENGLPLEGARLRLSGSQLKGQSGTDTFSITVDSEKDGAYGLSQVTPANTDQISILPESTDKVPIGNGGYAHFIFLENNYVQLAAPYFIPRSDWGKNITLNYQFRRR